MHRANDGVASPQRKPTIFTLIWTLASIACGLGLEKLTAFASPILKLVAFGFGCMAPFLVAYLMHPFFPMKDDALADELLADHLTASAALIELMLENLPDEVRTRALDAVRNGTGKVELRTRVESNETELMLVPADGTEPLWLTEAAK